jgi:hypothetical protein
MKEAEVPEEFFTMITTPRQAQGLVLTPRQKWKAMHHRMRWEIRYKKPYPDLFVHEVRVTGFKSCEIINLNFLRRIETAATEDGFEDA